ncbi:MAG: molecular chaperone, partial [Providencia sp.]
MKKITQRSIVAGLTSLILYSYAAQAAVSMDRTRVVFEGGQ